MWFTLRRIGVIGFAVALTSGFVGMTRSSATARATPATSAGSTRTKDAPVDAYFGPFKMSPLSIRSTIGFLGRQYYERRISDHDLLHKAVIVQDALNDWRKQYPHDGWMAPTYFHLYELFEAVQTSEARKLATDVANDVIRMYPKTHQAHLCRLRLAQGFPPLIPETPLVTDSPTPGAEPSAASGDASPAPSAAPSADASPSPSPAATPSASPT